METENVRGNVIYFQYIRYSPSYISSFYMHLLVYFPESRNAEESVYDVKQTDEDDEMKMTQD